MRELRIGLLAEGPTDVEVFSAILPRLLPVVAPVSVAAIVDLWAFARGERREQRVCSALEHVGSNIDLLVLHADGAGDWAAARSTQVAPGLAAAKLLGCVGVGLVPVREMEAWLLADITALEQAFRISVRDPAFGVPSRAADAERVLDPKLPIRAVYRAAQGKRARSGGEVGYFGLIAENVRVPALLELPSCRRFVEEVVAALG